MLSLDCLRFGDLLIPSQYQGPPSLSFLLLPSAQLGCCQLLEDPREQSPSYSQPSLSCVLSWRWCVWGLPRCSHSASCEPQPSRGHTLDPRPCSQPGKMGTHLVGFFNPLSLFSVPQTERLLCGSLRRGVKVSSTHEAGITGGLSWGNSPVLPPWCLLAVGGVGSAYGKNPTSGACPGWPLSFPAQLPCLPALTVPLGSCLV